MAYVIYMNKKNEFLKEGNDRWMNNNKFTIGDKVLVQKHHRNAHGNKLEPTWDPDPHVVVQSFNGSYKLMNTVTNKLIKQTMNERRLKKFISDEGATDKMSLD
ncbi:unnamed protein product [Cunninghamella echinulata]